jgi:hypothetical protein
MAATLSTKLGNPEVERMLRVRLESVCNQYPNGWQVSILGAPDNDVWELKVMDSDARTVRLHKLHGRDGEHDPEKILVVLEKITVEIFPRVA